MSRVLGLDLNILETKNKNQTKSVLSKMRHKSG